jgi:hypothetical protein
MLANAMMSFGLIQLFNGIEDKGWMIMAIGIYGTAIILIKFIFATIHHIKFYIESIISFSILKI